MFGISSVTGVSITASVIASSGWVSSTDEASPRLESSTLDSASISDWAALACACFAFSSLISFLIYLVIYPAISFFRPFERIIEIWSKTFLLSAKSSPNFDLWLSKTSYERRFILSNAR